MSSSSKASYFQNIVMTGNTMTVTTTTSWMVRPDGSKLYAGCKRDGRVIDAVGVDTEDGPDSALEVVFIDSQNGKEYHTILVEWCYGGPKHEL